MSPTPTSSATAPATQDAGPSAAERRQAAAPKREREAALAKKRAAALQKKQAAARAKQHRAAKKLAARTTHARQSGFDAFMKLYGIARVDQQTAAAAEPSDDTTNASAREQAASVADSGSSSSTPDTLARRILVALFGIAVLLLALAALPPSALRRVAFADVIVSRRLEIGLLGSVVLASAAIGLLVTIAS